MGTQDLIGRTVGRYRIEEELGAGGMGVVYRASDCVLERQVAVKFQSTKKALDAEGLARFLQEARTASSLAHPNICTIHDYGELEGRPYIVMEHLKGKTLQIRLHEDPLPPEEAVWIVLQVARGLEAAHRAGIIHRDIKPGNIFITQEGQIKILDFGLAKQLLSDDQDPGDASTQLTKAENLVLGTVDYMSPEQALGKPLDQRTDLFSLGVVFYQMLSGERPFHSGRVISTIDCLINRPPKPSRRLDSVSGDLQSTVKKLLEKNPDRRYRSASELISDLDGQQAGADATIGTRRPLGVRPDKKTAFVLAAILLILAVAVWQLWDWGAVRNDASGPAGLEAFAADSAARRPVVAVMPLANLSDDPSVAGVGLGIAHTLITNLSGLRSVTMISPSATLGKQDESADMQKAAHELGADYFVTGAVQKVGDRLLVTLNLVRDDSAVWGGQTEGRQGDLFELQRRLFERLAGALQLVLTEDERRRLQTRPTRNNEAYADYLQARSFLERRYIEGNQMRAIGLFQSAIEKDDSFSLAHAGLGEAYWVMYEKTREPGWTEKARQAAQRALELDPDRPEVRSTMAIIYKGSGQNQQAIDQLRQVLRLQPNNDDARRLLGGVLESEGRIEEAIGEFKRAIQLRPNFWGNHRALGLAFLKAGRYEEAIPAFQRFVELQPDSAWGFQNLGVAHHMLGNEEQAIGYYSRAIQVAPNAASFSNLGTIYYRRGDLDRAARNYEKALELQPSSVKTLRNLGDAYQRLGQTEKAAGCYVQAITDIQTDLRVNPNDARKLAMLALLEAKLGRRTEAFRHAAEAVELAPDDNQVLYRKAVVLAMAGQKAAAVQALKMALERGYSASEAKLDDDLAALRNQPDFRHLLQNNSPRGSLDE